MIVIICSILAAVAVVVTGLVTVGAVTAELAARPARSVFDLEEALDFVVERLSFEATANLSFEEVDQILRFHLNYLHAKGIELNGTALQDDGGAVLVDEDDALGWVMMQAEEYDIDLEETHAVEIVDAQMEYLSGIGAVGRPAPEPADFSETDDSETDDSGADD